MEFTVPQSWNELTPWQLPRIAKAIFTPYKNKRIQQAYILLLLFLKKPTLKTLWRAAYLFRQVPLSTLKTYADFLYKTDDLTKFPNIKGMAGPGNRMIDTTINEFAYADVFYYNWTQKKMPIDLERLAATLYRKNRKGSRPVFQLKEMTSYGRQLPKLSEGELIAIMLAFQGTRKLLIKTHRHIFKGGGGKGQYTSFSKIINDMATSTPQPFGDFYKTQTANTHDFLKVLDQQLAEAKRKQK